VNGAFLDKLQVLVTGVDAAIARDIVRLAVSGGASVIAADGDAAKLGRLDRDVGLYRTRVETAHVNLASLAEVKLWEGSLRAFGRLPHLLICCCNSPACPAEPAKPSVRRGRAVAAADVALSEWKGLDCPAQLANRVLQPTLFLHAEPLRRSAFNRAISVLRHPTLRGVLDRAPGHGVFNPETAIPYGRIASRLYSVRRQIDSESAPQGRIRLTPPPARAARRAAA
jgi:NAD(P)-dependent dehydrogenase (short-subunit alcohol dehydrogenase family)